MAKNVAPNVTKVDQYAQNTASGGGGLTCALIGLSFSADNAVKIALCFRFTFALRKRTGRYSRCWNNFFWARIFNYTF
ncbi:MAG: hypothetical protein AABZ06_03400 [Bdellovibrionota bacterium]